MQKELNIKETSIIDNDPVKLYNQKRTNTDLNITKMIRVELSKLRNDKEIKECYDSNRFIKDSSDKTPEIQRFLLNRYLTQQLMSGGKETSKERYCLIPNGLVDEWFSLVQDGVLPYFKNNKLEEIS